MRIQDIQVGKTYVTRGGVLIRITEKGSNRSRQGWPVTGVVVSDPSGDIDAGFPLDYTVGGNFIRAGAPDEFDLVRLATNTDLEANLPPQEVTVLRHLQKHGSITAGEAQLVHRIRSVSRRISSLKQAGFPIQREIRKDETGQRYARYSLGGAE